MPVLRRLYLPEMPARKQYGSDTENTLHTIVCEGLKPRIKVVIWFPNRRRSEAHQKS